jgi:hypothetical protein
MPTTQKPKLLVLETKNETTGNYIRYYKVLQSDNFIVREIGLNENTQLYTHKVPNTVYHVMKWARADKKNGCVKNIPDVQRASEQHALIHTQEEDEQQLQDVTLALHDFVGDYEST